MTPHLCAYCGDPIEEAKPFWVVERWEGGRVVARGFAGSYGCLHAISAFQGPRTIPPSRGALEAVVEDRVIESGEHAGG